jgi:hypothetical protein
VQWKQFLEGHRFITSNGGGTFEVDTKKLDLTAFINGTPKIRKEQCHFIRIGILNDYSPRKIEMQHRDGRMIVTPPRLNCIRIKQQSFRQCMEQFKWNYILEEEENDKKDDDDEDKEDEDDDDDDDDDSNVDGKGNTSSPTTSNKKRKYNAVMVTPGDDDVTQSKSDMAESYPHLSRALGGEDGFDPTNPSVQKSMRSLLNELNCLLSMTYQLDVSGISNKKISYVRVPRTQSDRSFLNSKEWLDTAIQINGSKHGGTFESAYRITNHIIRFYRDSFLAACETQGVPMCKPMSATHFQAMLCAGRVSGTGEKELKKHLSAHLGKGFCPTRRSVDMLSDGHCEVYYGSMEFTYDKKEKAEFIEWTEKNVEDEIAVNLQRHLMSKSIAPSEVESVQVVVGGDHGDTAFQFGASVSVNLMGNRIIDFEVSVCELICRKDTSKLIESTILPRLTKGLEIVATWHLHIEMNDDGLLECEFKQTRSENSQLINIYVTGDLAFQAMALGKESMAGWWCMLCKAPRSQFLDQDSEMWTMEELVRCGTIAENNNDEPQLGVKQRPWWPFIPLTNHVSPILHCEIGIGNLHFELFRDIINEHIEIYAPGEQSIRLAIPTLKQIIASTSTQRDEWDNSPEGNSWKRLKRAVAAYHKRRETRVEFEWIANDDEEVSTYESNVIKLKHLQNLRDVIVEKLKKARRTLANQQTKLKEMRRAKVRGQQSIETKVFKVLKEIGVELSSYHGGSLNGKDIKKVMNNASHIFDQFAAICKEGKREDCLLTDADIDCMCLHFWEVYVLWDGAFSLARTINPTDEDADTYQRFVLAALHGSKILQCPITPKVHTMLRHVAWQMRNIPGGLGDKMEDWVERLHQWGMQQRRHFQTVQNPLVRALAREKATSRNKQPKVLAQVDATDAGNKRKFLSDKKADVALTRRKRQRDVGRFEAITYFDHMKEETLTWAEALFHDGKVDSYGDNADVMEE